jgi:hypothetical protein
MLAVLAVPRDSRRGMYSRNQKVPNGPPSCQPYADFR